MCLVADSGGWRQVARNMHNPNSILDARSASPLAPDSITVIGKEGLWNLSRCNQRYTIWSKFWYWTVM